MGSPRPGRTPGPTLEEAVRSICWDLSLEKSGLRWTAGPGEFQEGFRAGFAAALSRAREILDRYAPDNGTEPSYYRK